MMPWALPTPTLDTTFTTRPPPPSDAPSDARSTPVETPY